MFADAGAKTPPLMGTTTPAAVADAVRRAIVDDKVEIAVAPLLDRVAAHAGMVSPRRLGPRPERQRRPDAPPRPSPTATRRTSVEPAPFPYPSPKGSSHEQPHPIPSAPVDPRGRRPRLRDLPPRRAAGALRRRPPAVLDQGAAGERAAARGRGVGVEGRRRGDRLLGRRRRAERRDPLPAGPRADAGLHRRARRRRPRRDAGRDGRDRRRRRPRSTRWSTSTW